MQLKKITKSTDTPVQDKLIKLRKGEASNKNNGKTDSKTNKKINKKMNSICYQN